MLITKEKSKQHQHSYVFYKTTKKHKYFKCNDPNCTHFLDAAMLLGKKTLCPKCKESVFILTHQALKRKRPLCLSCSNTKEAKQHAVALGLASMLFKDMPMSLDFEGDEDA